MGTLDPEPIVSPLHLKAETLELIRAIREIAKEEDPFFATEEDCSYFRTLYRALPPEPVKAPQKAAVLEPLAPPKPVKEAPAPPQPKQAQTNIPLPEKSAPLPPPDHFDDLRALFAKIAPRIQLIDELPSDLIAKQIAECWKTRNQAAPISVLSFHEPPQHSALLEHLTEALNVIFKSARLIQCAPIERDKQWEMFLSAPELKTVIICDAALWQLPNLLQFYREVPSHSERFLHQTPVFLLPDLSLYLKDPLLKRSLWKALCQKLA